MDISGWVSAFFGQCGVLISSILGFLLSMLPPSPFQMLSSSSVYIYLRYLNYFVPVGFMVSTLEIWLSAVVVFYAWQILLRWAKAVE